MNEQANSSRNLESTLFATPIHSPLGSKIAIVHSHNLMQQSKLPQSSYCRHVAVTAVTSMDARRGRVTTDALLEAAAEEARRTSEAAAAAEAAEMVNGIYVKAWSCSIL